MAPRINHSVQRFTVFNKQLKWHCQNVHYSPFKWPILLDSDVVIIWTDSFRSVVKLNEWPHSCSFRAGGSDRNSTTKLKRYPFSVAGLWRSEMRISSPHGITWNQKKNSWKSDSWFLIWTGLTTRAPHLAQFSLLRRRGKKICICSALKCCSESHSGKSNESVLALSKTQTT